MPSEVTAGRKKVIAVRFPPIEERGGSRPAFLGGKEDKDYRHALGEKG